jgi:hypothetical protein
MAVVVVAPAVAAAMVKRWSPVLLGTMDNGQPNARAVARVADWEDTEEQETMLRVRMVRHRQ